jgi:hypothetical protein
MPMLSNHSTTRRKDSQTILKDLLLRRIDLKTRLILLANVLVLNLLLPKPPVTSSPETLNSGIKPKHFVPHLTMNTIMPPKPEDKNSNSLSNLKRWSKVDLLKLRMRMPRDNKESQKQLDIDLLKTIFYD